MITLQYKKDQYTAKFLSNYDGDTAKVKFVDAPKVIATIRLRLFGFDTPELRGKCLHEKKLAREAKKVANKFLKESKDIWIIKKKYDKYGRMVVEVPGLAKHLVDLGLARYYKGGRRKSWCK